MTMNHAAFDDTDSQSTGSTQTSSSIPAGLPTFVPGISTLAVYFGPGGKSRRCILLCVHVLVVVACSWLCRFRHHDSPLKKIIVLGVTGGGKSTLGNTMLGREEFVVGHDMASCTDEMAEGVGHLFGDNGSGVLVDVIDTRGLGDTEGRDGQFVDDILAHLRENGGVHGIVFVHRACEKRLSTQTRNALATAVATLGGGLYGRQRLASRLSVVLTGCTDQMTRVQYSALPHLLCDQHKLCSVPLFWYDDWSSWGKFWLWLKPRSWRTEFRKWTVALPNDTISVPSKIEEERLKMELRDEIGLATSSCFSPDSLVIDRALGPVMMKDLVVGSEVATADGWSTVTTFLHWHPNMTVRALKIVHDHGVLTLSPEHMVFAMTEDEVARDVPAAEIEAGSMSLQVSGPKGELVASFVHSVESTTMQGYYAPLTSSGTILVNNVVASCYTQHSTYKISHWATNVLSAPLRFLSGWSLTTYVPDAGDRHPCVMYSLELLDSVARIVGMTG